MFFTILDRRKNAKIFSISDICYINEEEWKISGVAWTLLNTEEHRLIMATRHKLSRLSLRLKRDFFFYEHILGPIIYNSIYVDPDGHEFLYSLVGFDRSIFYLFTLFVYLSILQLFAPQNDDISYVMRNFTFFIDWNISETWTRIKLKQLSKMLLGFFSEK